MNRAIARALHETTNATYWMENPNWKTDNEISNFALSALRKLPFSIHEFQKKHLFVNSDAITVSGESVVLTGDHTVWKYMFRYPGEMPLDEFYQNVETEVKAVTRTLGGIALPTSVQVATANIFKRPFSATEAVMQMQPRLNLEKNPVLDLENLPTQPSHQMDTTLYDLETLVKDVDTLVADYGYYPDIAKSSSNLRRDMQTGSVTLIDVMPIHADGTRLIGDSPSKLPHNLEALDQIEEFVGKFGA